ncbi:ANTR6 [Scenedesmus sp. PABB004]|nr:ANTR6 [Scenedesmus sp. PABB004]
MERRRRTAWQRALERARVWLLSRQAQLVAQVTTVVVATSVFTVAKPLHFAHACLAPVFAVIAMTSLAQDQHVGTRLMVTSMLVGPAWLGIMLAGGLLSLAKLAPSEPGVVAAASVLSLAGLALPVLARAAAPPGPARLLAVLAAVMFGIVVLLGMVYPTIPALWRGAVGAVMLALVVAAAAGVAAGLLVAPSLASDEVIALTAEALRGAGAIISFHTSALMEPALAPPGAAAAAAAPAAPQAGGHVALDVRGGAPRSSLEHHATLDWVDEAEANAGSSGSSSGSIGSGSIGGGSIGSGASLQSAPSARSGGGPGSAGEPRLEEQLLRQHLSTTQPGPPDITAAWAAAAALAHPGSRQASLAEPLEDAHEWHGLFAAPGAAAHLAAAGGQGPRESLDMVRGASLEFAAEQTDAAFLESMRILSRSRPHGSSASLAALGSAHGPTPSAPSVLSAAGSGAGAGLQGSASAGSRGALRAGLLRGLRSLGGSWHGGRREQPGPLPPQQATEEEPPARRRRKLGASVSWQDLGSRPGPRDSGSPPRSPEHAEAGAHATVHAHAPAASVTSSVAQAFPTHRLLLEQQATALAAASAAAAAAAAGARAQAPPLAAPALGPVIARAKALLPAARVEPPWLRPAALGCFDADAWGALLEDAELLVVRVTTLEALSEERQLQGLEGPGAHLEAYRSVNDAMSLTLAQLAAFLAHVSRTLERLQARRAVPRSWLPAWLRGLCAPRPRPAGGGDGRARRPLELAPAGSGSGRGGGGSGGGCQRPSPFAAAAAAPPCPPWRGSLDGGAAGAGRTISAALSGALSGARVDRMERQASGVSSSYIFEKKTGWATGRLLLQREMESAVGAYWLAVRRASRRAPVKVPRAREVMTLTFVWPVTNGILDALERIEASAQRVLRSVGGGPAPGRGGVAPPAGAGAPAGARGWLALLGGRRRRGGGGGWRERWRAWRSAQARWLLPLARLLLVQPGLLAVRQALLVDLPAALASKQGRGALLRSRHVQAGLKLYLVAGSTMLATLVLLAYMPRIRSAAPIFGFTTACISMQPRVEATADKVVGRVLGTVVGGALGLALNSIPGIFGSPPLLLACLGLASAAASAGAAANAQARVGVALALITLLAITACGFELACCTPGPHLGAIDMFLTRLGSVVAACVYVAVVNQAVLPWYTSSYALEQMAGALATAAGLFEAIHTSQTRRMRAAAVAAGALAADGGGGSGAGAGAGADAAAAAAAELAALEAAEAGLHVSLRQDVLRVIVEVQLSLATESVAWRGVLSTPQVVLDVLGALTELVEALASQRLALAPFTAGGAGGAGASGGDGLLRISAHCASVWSEPLQPAWLDVLAAVRGLAASTEAALRDMPRAARRGGCAPPPADARAGAAAERELLARLAALEAARVRLRRDWLEIRTRLHRRVHAGGGGSDRERFWPTDSVHFFTFSYGASRVLNKLAGVAQACLRQDALLRGAEAPAGELLPAAGAAGKPTASMAALARSAGGARPAASGAAPRSAMRRGRCSAGRVAAVARTHREEAPARRFKAEGLPLAPPRRALSLRLPSRTAGQVQEQLPQQDPAAAPQQPWAQQLAAPLAPLQAWWDALPSRHKVVLAGALSFVICNMDKVNMSVAIIPMAQDFGWSPSVAGLVQSAFFWGYIISQLPGGYLTSAHGGRRVMPAGVAMWSLATAAVPLLAGTVPGLCLSRAAVGLGEAVAPSAATDMVARLVPASERSTAVSFVFGGLHVGSILGLLAAPYLITHVGWPAVFVTFGAAGAAWVLWFEQLVAGIAAADPDAAAALTADRLGGAAAPAADAGGHGHAAGPLAGRVPWRAFLRSRAVRALMFTHFANNWFHYTMLAWLPTYFTDTMSVDLMHAAQTALLPPLAGVAASAVAGPAADALIGRGVPVPAVRKLAQCTAFLVPAACLAAAGAQQGSEPGAAVALITAALGISSFSLAGLYCTHQDLSPKYASALLGLTNTSGAVPGILGVAVTGWIYDTTGSWAAALFYPTIFFLATGAAVYAFLGSNAPEDFDAPGADAPFGAELALAAAGARARAALAAALPPLPALPALPAAWRKRE